MSVTDLPVPLVAEGSGETRAALIQGLVDLAAFYETHPSVPLPGDDGRVVVSIRVIHAARGTRLETLAEIAELLGEDIIHEDGCHVAQRHFGPVTLRAAIAAEDFTDAFLHNAARKRADDARRAAMAATPAGSAA